MKKMNLHARAIFAVILMTIMCALATITLGADFAETADWINENPNATEDYAFSIAVVGDTQTLVEKDTKDGTSYTASIYDWIVENSKAMKMKYVLGLGDITQNDTDAEWTYAKSQITKMNAVVPYTLIRGGLPHDSGAQFDKYFANEAGYTKNISGYYEEGSVVNTYSTFTFGDQKYLILSLDFGAVDEVLEWAGNVIDSEEFSDHKVIVTTHSYLWKDGTTADQNEKSTAIPDKKEYTSDDKYNNGDEMWDKFVSKHENIFLIMSGHFTTYDIIASQAVGDNGNIVTQMMINPDTFDYKSNYETSMVCMLYFSEDANLMSVEWYSTYRDQFYRPANQFDIKLDELSLGGGITTEYGFIPARYYDPENYPYALFKKEPSHVDGVDYEYTFYGCAKSLTGDTALGVTSTESAYSIARNNLGDGAVILMLRPVTNTDTGNYSNLQYHTGSLTLDLGGYTMTDDHKYATALFYCHMKTANNHMRLTIKNGTLLVGNRGLTQYGAFEGKTNCSMSLFFEDMTLGYTKDSTCSYLIPKYAEGSEYSGCFPINFDNCTIDMKNAPDGAKIATSTSGETVIVTNSKIINSTLSYNVDEYGYASVKPTEDEHIAVYKKVASSPKVDGVTYPFEYTFVGYYKALYANSTAGITTTDGAYHAARTVTEKGNEAVIVLLSNHEITSDSGYSNHDNIMKNVIFDLRGYTLTDSNTHKNVSVNTTIFDIILKNSASSVFTLKNGNVVLGTDPLCYFDRNGHNDHSFRLVFEDINFSWKESGNKATSFIGGSSYRNLFPVNFKNCVIDLKNASQTMKLENGGSFAGVSFKNTKIINSTDPAIFTSDESDCYDGSYIINEYGIIPLAFANENVYPFAAFKKSNVTINGIGYAYTHFKSYKVLMGDTKLGITANGELGFSSLRETASDGGGAGTVLLMRRDFTDTSTTAYNNLCYNQANVVFDLGGHTLTDKHTHSTGLFYFNLRTNGQNGSMTIKNGSIVLGTKGLVTYLFTDKGGDTHSTVIFDSVDIGFAKGATAAYLFGKSTAPANKFSASLVNCIIDLENTPTGFNIRQSGSSAGGIDFDVTDTIIINSDVFKPNISLMLQDNFVLNAYIPTTAKVMTAKVTSIELCDVNHSVENLEKVDIDGTPHYKVSCNIAPNAVADTINLTVYADYIYTFTDNTSSTISTTLEWQIDNLDYFKTIPESKDDVASTLAHDILSYVRAVYVYCNDSDKLDYVTTFVDKVNGKEYDAANLPVCTKAVQNIEGMTSVQLMFDKTPSFVFYPETDEDSKLVYPADSYTFTLDKKYSLNPVVTTDKSGKTVIIITVPAYAFDNTIEYTIKGTNISGAYNLQAYFESISGGNDANLISLVQRLQKYSESAEAYKNSLN